ncbi:MAG: bifunctional diaminohydroxyphosphoribosylaminopyrimidine deaminase/5-amino-6-(5-phosphoribosylamino)uracil reductase RibD [Eubacterium sp.]|nr:bifunctional diaminohydroxyphosphoribosylaminopyrimidine deaminase/5-amino-6-(5-phosphoribosylamino)uracil reductase RibD [Eubacterium sp.]
MSYEKKYMERAIELAKKGIGAVNPNPLVGAVIVKDNEIIGEGYHTKYGDLHAEREALKDAEEKGNDVKDAEMYVTLEPCSHTGKQPPCTEAILESGIKRVYIGSDDPNPLVAGSGVWELRMAGIEVVTHCMKDECDNLNPVFFHYITQNTPYVIYKYAMTLDGKTCTCTSKSRWISNDSSRELVQKFRNEFSAIMVGIGTVLKDDPSLVCHMDDGRNPIRIICDSQLNIPMDSQIVKTAGEVKTYVASLCEHEKKNRQKIRELKSLGIGTLLIPGDENGVIDLNKLMIQLGKMKIDSVLLEGGGRLAWSMFEYGYVDEIRCFLAPKVFGGEEAGTPVLGPGVDEPGDAALFKLVDTEQIDGDLYMRYVRDVHAYES